MADRLTVKERAAVLEALQRLSYELADASAWLDERGAAAAAGMLQDAARSVASGGWILETPWRRTMLAQVTSWPDGGAGGG